MHVVSHKAIRLFCEEHPGADELPGPLVPGCETRYLERVSRR